MMLSVEKHRNLLKVSFKPLELFVDARVKHQAHENFSNPFVSIASWATQKILFSKLILERSNVEFLYLFSLNRFYILRYKELENVNKPSRIADMVYSPFKSPEKLKQYVTSSFNKKITRPHYELRTLN